MDKGLEISCSVKPAVFVTIPVAARSHSTPVDPEHKNETRPSGCQVIDCDFHSPIPENIGCIAFRNHYTHSITLKFCQTTGQISNSKSDKTTSQWKTCIPTLVLMPNCHCDRGSENLVVLNKAHFSIPLNNVSRACLILRQPSPDWIQFGIKDLKFYCVSSPFCQDVIPTSHHSMSSERMEQILGNGLWTESTNKHQESEHDTKANPYSVTILSYT